MATATATTQRSNPNPNGEWIIVSRRRRGGKTRLNHPLQKPADAQSQALSPTQTPPSPWLPIDSALDPVRESKLLKRMQSVFHRLENSHFYRRFLSTLRDPRTQSGLARALGAESGLQLVVYGIGSIESYGPPCLQLALAALLRRDLGPAVAAGEVFDPVLSAVECAVMRALGFSVASVDEGGRREVRAPTLFYMPHCEAALYDALLGANWRPAALNRMVVLGNSFAEYARYVSEAGRWRGSVAVEEAARRVLGATRWLREVGMEGERRDGGKEDEDEFFKAFHDTSWHFFEVDDDSDMDLAIV